MRADIADRLREDAEAASEVEITRDKYGYTIDGVFMRRVTTMLGGIPKEGIPFWAAKLVAEAAVKEMVDWKGEEAAFGTAAAIKLLKNVPWAVRDEAAVRGTAVHETLDALVTGVEPPENLTDDERACVADVRQFHLRRGAEVLASELTVYHPELGFAGTLDRWELHEGVGWILDYKTSKAVRETHAVQQAAYRNCTRAIVSKVQVGKDHWIGRSIHWGPDMAERMGVIHVKPTGTVLYPIRDELVEVMGPGGVMEHIGIPELLWRTFRAAAHIKKFLLDTDSFAGRSPRVSIYDTIQGGHDEQD